MMLTLGLALAGMPFAGEIQMAERPFGEEDTVTVLRSFAVGRADQRAAIRLETLEAGTIVFEVTLQNISVLRKSLDAAEKLLRQRHGTT